MRRAIELSREKMQAGEGGPFAAVVVKDGVVIGEGWNQVTSHNDPTAHAEVVAIRDACSRLGTFALHGAVIYSSSEPCPMCLSAIYWARVEAVYFGATTAGAAAIGFDDGVLYEEIARPACERSLPCSQLLEHEAESVFAEWQRKADRVEY